MWKLSLTLSWETSQRQWCGVEKGEDIAKEVKLILKKGRLEWGEKSCVGTVKETVIVGCEGNIEEAQWALSSVPVDDELDLLLMCFKRCKENTYFGGGITFDCWGIPVSLRFWAEIKFIKIPTLMLFS